MQRASFPACPSFDMGCGASKSPAVSTDEKPEMRSGIDETVDVAAVPDTASVVTASEKHSCEDVGAPQTLEYRRFLQSGGAKTSFWHDVPLYASRAQLRRKLLVAVAEGRGRYDAR